MVYREGVDTGMPQVVRIDTRHPGAGATEAPAPGPGSSGGTALRRFHIDRGVVTTVLAGLAGAAMVWMLITLALFVERGRASQNALQDTAKLARTLQESLDRRIETIDARLRFAQTLYARDPEGFAFGTWAGIDPAGRDLVQGLVVGLDGRAWLNERGRLETPQNLADQRHVRVHLDHPERDVLHTGEPAQSAADGRWLLSFSRPLRTADGALAGVAVIALDATGLSHLYESLELGSGTIAVIGLDGIIRARAPHVEDRLGARVPGDVLEQFAQANLPQLSFRRESVVDGLDRFITIRRLEAQPLVVFVGVETQAALANFYLDRRRLLGLGVMISTLIALAVALVEQKRASGRLARAQLEALVESLSQGVLMVGADARIGAVNARAVQLLGLPPGLAVPGRPIGEVRDWQVASGEAEPDPDDTLRSRARLALRAGPEGTYEHTRPDGTVLEIRTEKMPDGGVVRTYTDVTAQRRARDALAAARDAALAAEAALAAAIENVPQGIIMVGGDRRLKVINRQAGMLLGLPPELARPGVHVRAILDWQVQQGRYQGDPHALADALRGMAAPKVEPVWFERRMPDGRLLEVRTVTLPDGGGVRSYTDITERRRQEQALEDAHAATVAAEAALSAAIENVPQGIMLLSAEGRVRVMNRRAAALMGVPPEVARAGVHVDQILDWQRGHGEFDPSPEIRALVADPAFGRPGGCPPQYERIRPDGTVVEVRTVVLKDGGAVRTFTDITERKRAEQEMAAARDAAEAGARSRTEFLAVMSHEIRTPLNAVIGLSGLLQDATLPPEQAAHARLIREAGDHLLSLVNDILDFSSLESGRLKLEEIGFDPRAETAAVIELLEPQARAKGLMLLSDTAPDVPARVVGDPGRLRQVLLNLLGNAVKFTEAGSVRLSIACAFADAQQVRLSFAVRDSGIGIPASAVPQLFSAFRQVDASHSRRYGGTGLGLAISRQLVERMGGTIGVESVPGRGSTFRFDIRLRPAASETHLRRGHGEGAAPAPEDDTPRLRILLAEDNSTNRLVLTHRLHQMGHRVDAVSDGLEALEAVRARPYDMVIMDMMMPGMDGLEATRAIRNLAGPESRLPIIGLTAAAMPEDEAACMAAGMNGYERKPIGTERLRAAIAAMAAQRENPPVGVEDEPAATGV